MIIKQLISCFRKNLSMSGELPITLTPKDDCAQSVSEELMKPWGRLLAYIPGLSSIDLVRRTLSVGRSPCNNVVIHKAKFNRNHTMSVSQFHFVIEKDDDDLIYISDLSKNGTFVNGQLIGKGKRHIMQNNDEISVAHSNIKIYVFKSMYDEDTYLPLELRKTYKVSHVIGRGAAGEVRLAYETATCKMFAMKKIIKGKCSNSRLHQLNHPQKIQNEVNILKSLSHPCVISMKEIVETNDEVFIVLDFMKGGELTNRILSIQPLTESNIKFLFYQMILALKYLHSQGISHRDLKPENVLLSDDSPETLVKLADFGLSKVLTDEDQMQTLCGTMNYIAPEILDPRQKVYDKIVDVWSLGVILYYMFAKVLPFQSDDRTALARLILKGAYDLEKRHFNGVSLQAQDLVRKMLTVNPEKRIKVDAILRHPWIARDLAMQYKVKSLIEANQENRVEAEGEEEISEPKRRRLDL